MSWDDVAAPAWLASEHSFYRAFGGHLRVVRLEGQDPRSYYQYRDAPELIVPHIRRFLEEITEDARKGTRARGAGPPYQLREQVP